MTKGSGPNQGKADQPATKSTALTALELTIFCLCTWMLLFFLENGVEYYFLFRPL